MIGAARLGMDPALPLAWIIGLGALGLAIWAFYVWRGGQGRFVRLAGLALVLVGLLGPQWVREAREPAEDVALVLVDQSESLALAGRREAAAAAGDAIAEKLAQAGGLDVRRREARSGPDGTAITAPIAEALADVARERIAGVIVITDGQASDAGERTRELAALGPVHTLIVGDPARGDRRLELISAPTFGIVGERMRVTARVIDPAREAMVDVSIAIDGVAGRRARVRANQPFDMDVRLPKRGRNMVILEAGAGPAEISASNNRAAFAATGVRDRLRVLLVTGEPYAGERVWRNLLKSDPAVDLVHFTILRPPTPDIEDYASADELALIEFPREELFEQRLDEFDLIIFDRFRRYVGYQTILEPYYFNNIARRVEQGGALLITAGEYEAGVDGVYRTALSAILPAAPTGRVIDEPYRPQPTRLGARHPVVRGLPSAGAWGRWTRQVEARASRGQVVLEGRSGRPLLVLDRVGRGRVAQLWSDQAWLWARGHDGGGPHGELLRRLAHWLMGEPELEDERLQLTADSSGNLVIERSSLGGAPGAASLIGPQGARASVPLSESEPGLWRGVAPAAAQGLYEARSGALRAFTNVGPLNPREAAALNAEPDLLAPLAEASGGAVLLTGEDGKRLPEIRRVERGASASGETWIGLRRNGAYVVRAARAAPLGPGWAWAFAGMALLLLGWRRETA